MKYQSWKISLNLTGTTPGFSGCVRMCRHTRTPSGSKPLLPSRHAWKSRLQRSWTARRSPSRTSPFRRTNLKSEWHGIDKVKIQASTNMKKGSLWLCPLCNIERRRTQTWILKTSFPCWKHAWQNTPKSVLQGLPLQRISSWTVSYTHLTLPTKRIV